MNKLQDFTGLYPLSKTLRFKLIPQGRTLEHFEESNLLKEDSHRAESYVKVKKIIDEYHKAYIEQILSDFALKVNSDNNKNSLEEYDVYYSMGNKKDDRDKKNFDTIRAALRKQIVDKLIGNEVYKRMAKKDLIEKDLVTFVNDLENSEEKKSLIEEFKNFTTYFTGFNKNRSNMYSADDKSTAIGYRLIHENLPKFIDNIKIFDTVMQSEVAEQMPKLYSDFEEYLNVKSISEMFELGYFNMVLTQKQIDVYNLIIGGKSVDGESRIQGLNEYINLYNQHHKEKRLPKLKLLFKQILSDRNVISWLPEKFESDAEMLKSIKDSYEQLSENVLGETHLKILLESLGNYDVEGIFISNDLQLTNISQQLFGSWARISDAVKQDIKNNLSRKKNESKEDYETRVANKFKTCGSFSIAYLNRCLRNVGLLEASVESYFQNMGAINTETQQKENLFKCIANAYTDAKQLLTSDYPESKNLIQQKDDIEKIKHLLDAIKDLQHFIKPLLGSGEESGKDERFYGEFTALWDELNSITSLYNMVRNYVTRKPYSVEKIKLNFANATLMDGWDLNMERDNTTVILRKNGMYYLGIMNKKHNKIFVDYPTESEHGCYEKMEYKQTGYVSRNIQNIILCEDGEYRRFTKHLDELKQKYIPDILAIKQNGSYLDENLCKENLTKFIDYYKDVAINYWSWCNFSFKDSDEYSNWKEFTDDVEAQGYGLSFRNVSADYINQMVNEGKLYLFQIYSKDFSSFSKGTPNMHTIYWKLLFDERNLRDVVYKLNGQAEVFFRKKSITYDRPTHPANLPIKNKNKDNPKKESMFEYDLIKNKRFTVDTFLFHVPIKMNFKSTGGNNINQKVNEYLRQNEDAHVIGIDRGERHLLYLVVVDRYGNIKEQFTLNEICNIHNGVKHTTNYHDLLEQKEKERSEARQSWQSIENIKELKEGYLSQVIHKISELMIKYNAIVVLEDLNFGFMRGRQKVEKQVYQKFEQMLIDKLNYLVDKKKDVEECGGALKAYQFTNKFESFQKLGKQSGFLFYIPAWMTSKIDPVTGFVNMLDTRYESPDESISFFSKFEMLRYNEAKGWFEFTFDYNKFDSSKAEGTRTHWTLCTHGTRIDTFRNPEKNNQWDSIEIDLTERFKQLFKEKGIDYRGNLKEEINNQSDKKFFEELHHLLNLTLQMRNSMTGTEIDYMISPVADENGNFYDSRTCGDTLPANADANGAYNIARKGLWVLQQIRQADDLRKINLAIKNKEWLNFVQQKQYLKK